MFGKRVMLELRDEDSIVHFTSQEADELAEFLKLEGEDSIKKAKLKPALPLTQALLDIKEAEYQKLKLEAKDTILAGCEIICIGEQPTDLIACPLSDEEQEKCRSRRQYESGRQARIKEVMEWIESHRLSGSLMHPLEYYQFELEQWQAKLKEWRI